VTTLAAFNEATEETLWAPIEFRSPLRNVPEACLHLSPKIRLNNCQVGHIRFDPVFSIFHACSTCPGVRVTNKGMSVKHLLTYIKAVMEKTHTTSLVPLNGGWVPCPATRGWDAIGI